MLALFQIEISRLFSEFKRYMFNNILGTFDVLLLCVGIFIGTGSEILSKGMLIYSLIGMVLWRYTSISLGSTCNILQKEIRIGTLEQLLLTKHSLNKVLLVRLISKLMVESIKLSVVSMVLVAYFDIAFSAEINYAVLLTGIITCIIGMIGLSYIVAGLTLIYKKANAVVNSINYFTLFFTGLIIPLDIMPSFFSKIAYGLPFYWCIETIKKNAFDLSFLFLLGVSLLWLLAGQYFFHKSVNRMYIRGSASGY